MPSNPAIHTPTRLDTPQASSCHLASSSELTPTTSSNCERQGSPPGVTPMFDAAVHTAVVHLDPTRNLPSPLAHSQTHDDTMTPSWEDGEPAPQPTPTISQQQCQGQQQQSLAKESMETVLPKPVEPVAHRQSNAESRLHRVPSGGGRPPCIPPLVPPPAAPAAHLDTCLHAADEPVRHPRCGHSRGSGGASAAGAAVRSVDASAEPVSPANPLLASLDSCARGGSSAIINDGPTIVTPNATLRNLPVRLSRVSSLTHGTAPSEATALHSTGLLATTGGSGSFATQGSTPLTGPLLSSLPPHRPAGPPGLGFFQSGLLMSLDRDDDDDGDGGRGGAAGPAGPMTPHSFSNLMQSRGGSMLQSSMSSRPMTVVGELSHGSFTNIRLPSPSLGSMHRQYSHPAVLDSEAWNRGNGGDGSLRRDSAEEEAAAVAAAAATDAQPQWEGYHGTLEGSRGSQRTGMTANDSVSGSFSFQHSGVPATPFSSFCLMQSATQLSMSSVDPRDIPATPRDLDHLPGGACSSAYRCRHALSSDDEDDDDSTDEESEDSGDVEEGVQETVTLQRARAVSVDGRSIYEVINEKYVLYDYELGKGSYSSVHLCYCLADRRFYAAKVLDKYRIKRRQLGSDYGTYKMDQEIAIMRQLQHRNIVRLREVIRDPAARYVFLILELAEGREVLTMRDNGDVVPRADGRTSYTEGTARHLVRGVLHALMYAHYLGIAHRDVKPSNMLTTAHHSTVKLCDFGVSVLVGESTMQLRREGSVAFLAPELLVSSDIDVSHFVSPAPSPTLSRTRDKAELSNSARPSDAMESTNTPPPAAGGEWDAETAGPRPPPLPVVTSPTRSAPHALSLATPNTARPARSSPPPFANDRAASGTEATVMSLGVGPERQERSLMASRHSLRVSSPHSSHTLAAPLPASAAAAAAVVKGSGDDGLISRYKAWLTTECHHTTVDLFKGDVFSLGVTVFTLLLGHLPWRASSASSQLRAVLEEPDPFLRLYREAYGDAYEPPAAVKEVCESCARFVGRRDEADHRGAPAAATVFNSSVERGDSGSVAATPLAAQLVVTDDDDDDDDGVSDGGAADAVAGVPEKSGGLRGPPRPPLPRAARTAPSLPVFAPSSFLAAVTANTVKSVSSPSSQFRSSKGGLSPETEHMTIGTTLSFTTSCAHRLTSSEAGNTVCSGGTLRVVAAASGYSVASSSPTAGARVVGPPQRICDGVPEQAARPASEIAPHHEVGTAADGALSQLDSSKAASQPHLEHRGDVHHHNPLPQWPTIAPQHRSGSPSDVATTAITTTTASATLSSTANAQTQVMVDTATYRIADGELETEHSDSAPADPATLTAAVPAVAEGPTARDLLELPIRSATYGGFAEPLLSDSAAAAVAVSGVDSAEDAGCNDRAALTNKTEPALPQDETAWRTLGDSMAQDMGGMEDLSACLQLPADAREGDRRLELGVGRTSGAETRSSAEEALAVQQDDEVDVDDFYEPNALQSDDDSGEGFESEQEEEREEGLEDSSSDDIYQQLYEEGHPSRPYSVAETWPLRVQTDGGHGQGGRGRTRTISAEAVDFVRACLALDPLQRRTVFELFHHPWIAGRRDGRGGRDGKADTLPDAEDDDEAAAEVRSWLRCRSRGVSSVTGDDDSDDDDGGDPDDHSGEEEGEEEQAGPLDGSAGSRSFNDNDDSDGSANEGDGGGAAAAVGAGHRRDSPDSHGDGPHAHDASTRAASESDGRFGGPSYASADSTMVRLSVDSESAMLADTVSTFAATSAAATAVGDADRTASSLGGVSYGDFHLEGTLSEAALTGGSLALRADTTLSSPASTARASPAAAVPLRPSSWRLLDCAATQSGGGGEEGSTLLLSRNGWQPPPTRHPAHHDGPAALLRTPEAAADAADAGHSLLPQQERECQRCSYRGSRIGADVAASRMQTVDEASDLLLSAVSSLSPSVTLSSSGLTLAASLSRRGTVDRRTPLSADPHPLTRTTSEPARFASTADTACSAQNRRSALLPGSATQDTRTRAATTSDLGRSVRRPAQAAGGDNEGQNDDGGSLEECDGAADVSAMTVSGHEQFTGSLGTQSDVDGELAPAPAAGAAVVAGDGQNLPLPPMQAQGRAVMTSPMQRFLENIAMRDHKE